MTMWGDSLETIHGLPSMPTSTFAGLLIQKESVNFGSRANVGGAIDSRVAPQAYTVLGGMNTIRGYPEAAAAGDQGWSASVRILVASWSILSTKSTVPVPRVGFGLWWVSRCWCHQDQQASGELRGG